MKVYIYALVDPRDTKTVRYVGQTNCPRKRHLQHCRMLMGPSTKREVWIDQLQADGLMPQMVILRECDELIGNQAEAEEIAKYPQEQLYNSERFSPRSVGRVKTDGQLHSAKESKERELIEAALSKHNGKMAPVARELGISRPTLYDKVYSLGIVRPDNRKVIPPLGEWLKTV